MRRVLMGLLTACGAGQVAIAAECRPDPKALAAGPTIAVIRSTLCTLEGGSDRKVRLTWFRLGEGLAGSLVGRQEIPELAELIGKPRVVENEVLSGAADLFNRFGLKQTFFEPGGMVKNASWSVSVNGVSIAYETLAKAPAAKGAKPLRQVWSLTQSLTGYSELAYAAAFQTVLKTRGWPTEFNQVLTCPAPIPGGEPADFIKCMSLWKYLTPPDLDPLTQEIREAGRRARGSRATRAAALEPQYQRHFRLFRHLAGSSWPTGFLSVRVDVGEEGCGSDGYWAFQYFPPTFALDVLVVANESAAPIRIDSLRGIRETGSQLRPAGAAPTDASDFTSLGGEPLTLPPGGRMALPARMLFLGGLPRPDPVDIEPDAGAKGEPGGPITAGWGDPEAALIASRRLRQVATPAVETTITLANREVRIRKDVAAFTAPAFPERADHRFGTSLFPREIVVDGATLGIGTGGPEDANALQLNISDQADASCPILFVWDAEAKDWVRIGKILHVAQGEDKLTTQRIPLPGLTTRIRLSEEEPERTSLKRVRLEVTMRDGQSLAFEPAERLPDTIEAYEFADIRFDLPDTLADAAVAKADLVITGYYERYATVLAKQAR